jgi:hypothetical protein
MSANAFALDQQTRGSKRFGSRDSQGHISGNWAKSTFQSTTAV